MKIVSTDTKPLPVTTERKPAKGAPQQPLEVGTQVLLSAAAKEITTPPTEAGFDSAKVDRISKAIRAGTFKVNPEAIADKLISHAKELLVRKPN
jgi:negative regulator of flagellin synthesis FlgM